MNQLTKLRGKGGESSDSSRTAHARGRDGGTDVPLDLVRRLSESLENMGIRQCHWKSTAALAESATGLNDLDLLVHRADVQAFSQVLVGLGFKEARSGGRRELPGICDYYGLDPASGKLVHIHAHYQLILGDDATKNYRLPMEEAYIASAYRQGLFRIPAPEFEFVVLVIRMVLKHWAWDAVVRGQGRLTGSEQRELRYLDALVDGTRVEWIVNEYLPYVESRLFLECAHSLQQGASVWSRNRMGRELKRKLTAHGREPTAVDALLRLWLRGYWRGRRYILKKGHGKRMANGGAIIAVVGGDGSGKSSIVKDISAWLCGSFDVRRIHMGKPPWSGSRVVLKIVILIRRLMSRNRTDRIEGLASPTAQLRQVLLARDRFKSYVKARRYATNGGVVVSDRYPIKEIRSMDGPKLHKAQQALSVGILAKYLADRERAYYRHIREPDVLIVLRVDAETAVRRKQDEEEAFVRARCEEVYALDWSRTSAVVIDSSRPQHEVLDEVKSAIWSRI